MTAHQRAGAGDAVGFEERQRRGKGLDAGQMRAIGAGARHDAGAVVEEQCDIAPLHGLGQNFGAVDQRALVGLGKAQQHRGNIAGRKRGLKLRREGRRVGDRRGDEIEAGGVVSAPAKAGEGDRPEGAVEGASD